MILHSAEVKRARTALHRLQERGYGKVSVSTPAQRVMETAPGYTYIETTTTANVDTDTLLD